ncbi:ribose 5-phosphate isomerase B [Alkalicella caledoniensis]|uniref:Ribose 5-phosphate isomerase B n=2 Tax=Alkalicella caledoniensis TaxID=2731377 RepID=A0A7G9WDB3_ALKCA|nr:ribose 5-phosphate isomerase B [Alkalicella caledoniensis]
MMKVAVASDHGGYKLKEEIKVYLEELSIEYKDFGCHNEESVDYPEYAAIAAKAVASEEYTCGIIICGTGIGVSIAANKIKGIRAANCHDCFSAQATREHNDANVLTLGERVVGPGLAKMIVKIFLETEFQGGRHQRRIGQITELEM